MCLTEVMMLRKLRNTTITFLSVSLLIHLSLWTGLYISKRIKSETQKDTIEITVLDSTQPKEKSVEETLKKAKEKRQQIVDQSKQQINDEKPEDARFLSRHNQKVIKQTRAAKNGKFTNSAKPGARSSGQKQKPEQKKKVTQRNKGEGSLPKLADLKPQFNPNPHDHPNEVSDRPPGDPSQTDDYLKDLETGAQTLLSTREFIYYSYYSRIKEKIRQTWQPKIREKIKMMYRKGRSIASVKDHVTQVIITLDNKGTLMHVELVTASGVHALDEAAVEAFKAAAPFPNPPDGIVEKDGRIRIRWDFILEASSYFFPESELKRRHES